MMTIILSDQNFINANVTNQFNRRQREIRLYMYNGLAIYYKMETLYEAFEVSK